MPFQEISSAENVDLVFNFGVLIISALIFTGKFSMIINYQGRNNKYVIGCIYSVFLFCMLAVFKFSIEASILCGVLGPFLGLRKWNMRF